MNFSKVAKHSKLPVKCNWKWNDLVILWCRTFLLLLRKSCFFELVLKEPQHFSWFLFLRYWKNLQHLANFAKNNCHDRGKRNQKSRNFIHKKTKTPSTGDWSCRSLLLRFFSCSLEEKSLILVFMTKTCETHISHWFHFAPYSRYGKQNLLKSVRVFTPCLPSELA